MRYCGNNVWLDKQRKKQTDGQMNEQSKNVMSGGDGITKILAQLVHTNIHATISTSFWPLQSGMMRKP